MLGISLIVAVGPQNILIIKQGIRQEYVTLVLAICFLSDVVLYTIGVVSIGHISTLAPHALLVLRILGAIYLLWFAFSAARDALHPHRLSVTEENEPEVPREHILAEGLDDGETHVLPAQNSGGGSVATRERVRLRRPAWVAPALTALALTWLNPGAYIDTIVMVGGVANQHGDPGRWFFAGGALLASAVWFPLIGYGARALAEPLSSPRVWSVLNWVIAAMLCFIAIRLLLG
ncbi:LysE/ArgO family amino acid transporter [Corynebacterium uropygiale]|uniref:LysE/ArgO family amino acid transporter n=1 Tax=Corynebacterium uropygiale TaxID=1775911 RepID=A0A9X1QSH8_9CORY|nr:LysE/ArgO family amino acid transporter [Corynebacterium uropygiale]MCF4006998.1 LysE/ArgO family amino acid transporter [Corynebacterium uropygiale]